MKAWMELWHEENIMHPEYSVLVMTGTLNPEPVYFYQRHDYRFLQGMPKLDMELVETCEPKDEATVNQIIKTFQSKTEVGLEMWDVLRTELGYEKVISVEVDHCPQSYACLLVSEEFGNIIYSGDTLECQNLLNYGQNARVLIHEATLQDGMEEDAKNKKHTTTSQAIQVGQKIRAWRTILTHFSPRYQKVSEISEIHLQTKTLVAFDHMRVALS